MNRAIITDVRYRMSLAAVRSIGRKGIPVTAVEFDSTPPKTALGFYSKYASDKAVVPSAISNPNDFIKGIIDVSVSRNKYEKKPVLIPVGLDSLMAVCKNKTLLEPHVNLIVPPLESIEISNDTNRLLSIASEIGIPCPYTTTLLENETVEDLSVRITYPAVIKYRQGELLKLNPEKRYKIIHTREDFCADFSRMHEIQPYPIVQRYIRGSGFGVSAVFDKNGEPLEIFCHRRIREYPVSGGPSCFCESMWDDRLVSYAIKLLKALKWRGVAMVEFKGELDSEICLMEINPRFWGSLPLSIAAGCNIPYAVYRAANGETTSVPSIEWNPSRYRLGKKMRFLFQDLLSFKGYLKLRKDKFKFAGKFLVDLFNPFVADGVLKFKDWRPSLRYIIQAFKKGMN